MLSLLSYIPEILERSARIELALPAWKAVTRQRGDRVGGIVLQKCGTPERIRTFNSLVLSEETLPFCPPGRYLVMSDGVEPPMPSMLEGYSLTDCRSRNSPWWACWDSNPEHLAIEASATADCATGPAFS